MTKQPTTLLTKIFRFVTDVLIGSIITYIFIIISKKLFGFTFIGWGLGCGIAALYLNRDKYKNKKEINNI